MRNGPNMSYCMFENTVDALQQIQDRLNEVSSIEELMEDASSDHERESIKHFFKMIDEFYEMSQDLDLENRKMLY